MKKWMSMPVILPSGLVLAVVATLTTVGVRNGGLRLPAVAAGGVAVSTPASASDVTVGAFHRLEDEVRANKSELDRRGPVIEQASGAIRANNARITNLERMDQHQTYMLEEIYEETLKRQAPDRPELVPVPMP